MKKNLSPRPDHRPLIWLAGLTMLALLLRLLFLGRAELWQDEMLLVQTAQPTASVLDVWRQYASIAVSMAWLPLPAAVENIFLRLVQFFDGSLISAPFWIRLPGALIGTLAVPTVFLLGRRLGGPALSISAGLWAAFSFYFIFYSREVHAYPLLLALSAWHWYWLARFWSGDSVRPLLFVLWALGEVALALTHLTAALMIAATALITVWLAVQSWCRTDRLRARRLLAVMVGQGLGLLAVAPYFMAILTQNNPHLAMQKRTPLLVMFQDFTARLTFGDRSWMPLAGWLVIAAGLAWFWHRRREAQVLIPLLAAGGLTLLLVGLAAYRTQYLSARYFAVLAPLASVLIGAGWLAVADGLAYFWPSSSRKRARAGFIAFAIGIPSAVNLFVFLPPYYTLTCKSVDFGSIARWLNVNQTPGKPYLMESAYELRFVGSYYPTPGLVGAAPYVHGGGGDEVRRLHESQQDFMQRFPEAPFIESAHHNWETPAGVWQWPHAFHARHVQLRNEPLRRLIRMGIFPGTPGETITEYSYVTDIYFSTEGDCRARARAAGDPAWLSYTGWQVVGLPRKPSESLYLRAATGAVAHLGMQNLAERKLNGRLRLVVGMAPSQGAQSKGLLRIAAGTNEVGRFTVQPSRLQEVQTGTVEIPVAGLNLAMELELPRGFGDARPILLLHSASFVEPKP